MQRPRHHQQNEDQPSVCGWLASQRIGVLSAKFLLVLGFRFLHLFLFHLEGKIFVGDIFFRLNKLILLLLLIDGIFNFSGRGIYGRVDVN